MGATFPLARAVYESTDTNEKPFIWAAVFFVISTFGIYFEQLKELFICFFIRPQRAATEMDDIAEEAMV